MKQVNLIILKKAFSINNKGKYKLQVVYRNIYFPDDNDFKNLQKNSDYKMTIEELKTIPVFTNRVESDWVEVEL